MRHQAPRPAKAESPRQRLNALCGRRLSSLGDYERLAGIDTCNDQERRSLWDGFRHLYAASLNGDVQPLFDAVTNHCAQVALDRVDRGELSLLA